MLMKGEVWGPKGTNDPAELLTIEKVTATEVYSHPRDGGFVGSMDREGFEKHYEHFDHARLAAMKQAFHRIDVSIDGYDDDFSIPAWTNGDLWNGWQKPIFEKDVLLKQIEKDDFTGPTMKFWFDEEIQSFVTIMGLESQILPEDLDIQKLKKEALSENGYAQLELKGVGLVDVQIANVIKFEAEGREVVAYQAFDGWCWEKALNPSEDKEAEAAPGL